MRNYRVLTLTISVLLVGMLAVPASAGIEVGVVAIQGNAEVGESIAPLTSVPQNGVCAPTGKGLHAPVIVTGKQTDKTNRFIVNKEVYYHLGTVIPAGVLIDTNAVPPIESAAGGRLDVCGIVGPGPLGIGAACGSSTGRDGQGKLSTAGEFFDIKNVNWVTAIGGVLPVYGHITRVSADKSRKFSAKGSFIGVVVAQGANPCINAKPQNGATSFAVGGVVVAGALGKAPGGKPNKAKLQ